MAYVLGFFAADGTMVKNKRGACFIEFHSTDKNLLQNIRRSLGSNHRIASRIKASGGKVCYRIQIGSSEVYEDILSLGFTPRKSKSMVWPRIPQEFLGDFIRGYFDGDGCVYFKKHNVSDRTNARWVFSSRFTCGSQAFLKGLHNTLLRTCLRGGFIVRKVGGFELVFSHHDSVALFQLMYDTVPVSGLFLARKRRIFERALWTLYKMRT